MRPPCAGINMYLANRTLVCMHSPHTVFTITLGPESSGKSGYSETAGHMLPNGF